MKYYKDDFNIIKSELINYLINNNITISTVESATAGAIASNICDVPGASSIFSVSYVTYSNEVKIKTLKVNKDIIDKYSVVSKEVAIEMAHRLYDLTKSDICISVTGNLGPSALDNKNIGLVYFDIYYSNTDYCVELNLSGDRIQNKNDTLYAVFNKLHNLFI